MYMELREERHRAEEERELEEGHEQRPKEVINSFFTAFDPVANKPANDAEVTKMGKKQ